MSIKLNYKFVTVDLDTYHHLLEGKIEMQARELSTTQSELDYARDQLTTERRRVEALVKNGNATLVRSLELQKEVDRLKGELDVAKHKLQEALSKNEVLYKNAAQSIHELLETRTELDNARNVNAKLVREFQVFETFDLTRHTRELSDIKAQLEGAKDVAKNLTTELNHTNHELSKERAWHNETKRELVALEAKWSAYTKINLDCV